MITNGFAYGFSDSVVLGTTFPYPSSYIYVANAGDIVYQNTIGEAQFVFNAGVGYHPIGAVAVLASGEVNGVTKTTTATDMTYCSSVKV